MPPIPIPVITRSARKASRDGVAHAMPVSRQGISPMSTVATRSRFRETLSVR